MHGPDNKGSKMTVERRGPGEVQDAKGKMMMMMEGTNLLGCNL